MAYKCKVCGYKFKKGDDDLCPQCFTARDDVHCFDEPGHSHAKDFSSERNNFLDEEKFRESVPTSQELSGQVHKAADELKKKYGTYQNDKHTYGAAGDPRKTSGTARYMEMKRQAAERQQNTSSSFSGGTQDSFQKRAAMQNYSALMNHANSKNQKKTNGCLVAFILIFFLFPILGTVVSSLGLIKRAAEESNKAQKIDTPSISMPDINVPDFSSIRDGQFNYDYTNGQDFRFKQEDFTDPTKKIVYVSCYKSDDAAEREASKLTFIDGTLQNEELREYHIDFVDEHGDSIPRERCTMTVSGIDANGSAVYYYDSDEDQDYFLAIEKVDYCALEVSYFDDTGKQLAMSYFFRLSDLPSYGR